MRRHNRCLIAAITLIFSFAPKLPLAASDQASEAEPILATDMRGIPGSVRPAKISIIIDDLGNTWQSGVRAIRLAGPVAYSILPFTRYSTHLARLANDNGKEVLLHMPMEPEDHHQAMSPGTLYRNMTREDFLMTLRAGLGAVPHVIGVNNHMGSLLTQQPLAMTWLMEELRRDGRLFFVDSRTSPTSIANSFARRYGLAHLPRNVFLDHDRNPASIESQFDQLLELAKTRGFALAIGHPYGQTLAMLENRLGRLAQDDVELVPVSRQVYAATARRLAAAGAGEPEKTPTPNTAPIFFRGQPRARPNP